MVVDLVLTVCFLSDRMPGNNYNGGSNHFSSRVERLLRDREQRKSNRISHSNEAIDSNGRGSESFEHELYLREEENARVYSVSEYLEGAAAASAVNEGCERQDGKPSRQRLLVVANRLPVSAIRRGEDSWSLEISAGGLVSALLGNWWLDFYRFNLISAIM